MSLESVPTMLPVLVVKDAIVFPGSQKVVAVDASLSQHLSRLVKGSDPPVVAVVPTLEQSPEGPLKYAKLSEWACAARIIRFARPSPISPNSCIISLVGITRVQLEKPLPANEDLESLPLHPIHYLTTESPRLLSEHAAETFRASAARLVERLQADASLKTSRAGKLLGLTSGVDWRKMKTLVEEADADRTPWIADILMSVTPSITWQDKLEFLRTPSSSARLTLATSIFTKTASISEVSQKISTAVDESLSKQQKEFYLRQQLHAIQRELANLNRGEKKSSNGSTTSKKDGANPSSGEHASELDDDGDDADYLAEIRTKIEAMSAGSEERKMGVKEYRRLKRIPAGSVEYGVIRTYLEWLTSIPWPNNNVDEGSFAKLSDPQFLNKAREQLEADHFGLENIKRRLIEYLAVIRLKALNPPVVEASNSPTQKPVSRTKGPILLLVGPPGSGKTSIASSLARALGRPSQRISLGGVRDEAEIRGHRRTYVASGPGAIVTALSKAGRNDPVVLLDEIDKVGHASYQGDPASALLEVLDPEQNVNFKDHYINVPLDLGQVIFIATANTLDTISEPLLDRCEVIRLSGYTYNEKIHIARKFLLPKQLEANGLPESRLLITDGAYTHITSYYTREAGVRSLERAIGSIARHKAVEWSECVDAKKQDSFNPTVDIGDLEVILGIPKWDSVDREREERKGVVYGLVVSGHGEGGVLPVESVMTSGTGKLRLTGSLGDVIRESGEIALSWVKANAFALGITTSVSQDPLKYPQPIDIHLHLPSGAVKKDGPSAGVAYVCAFVSLLTGLTVPTTVAMTGETTLRGKVTAVGGIKEKVLGAHREGIRKIILPRPNRKDVDHDVPQEVIQEMEFVYVSRMEEALEAAFGPGIFHKPIVESRL